MLLRLRTRDGTERLDVPPSAKTVRELKEVVAEKLKVPVLDQVLSDDQKVLLAADDDLAKLRSESPFNNDEASLASLKVEHGSLLYMRYTVSREATVSARPTTARFGAKMTVDDLVAKQIRIERQEKPITQSVSFDRGAANNFQGYIGAALGFRVMRAGIMYGTADAESGEVKVDAIYEPPQPHNTAVDVACEYENTEEFRRVEAVAKLLGLVEVGWIFSQTARGEDDDFTVSSHELTRMAMRQCAARRAGNELYVTAIVQQDQSGDVHFEAFQCSTQFCDLCERGVIVDPRTPGKPVLVDGAPASEDGTEQAAKDGAAEERAVGTLHTTCDVMVLSKDVREVDNDWFLVPVKIMDHVHPFLASTFAVENRLTPCTPAELKDHLSLNRGKPFASALADFHCLLFLSAHFDLATDMALLVDAVKQKGTVLDGYKTIIEAIAAAGG